MSKSDVLKPVDCDSILFKPKETTQTQSSSSSTLEHIVFLDYDDTLLPTTYLLSNIEYEMNSETKRMKTFSINGKSNETGIKQFVANLEKAGKATFKFLNKIISKFQTSNIKIVTNGVNGWIAESLLVAGTFCKIFQQIAYLLSYHKIEIIYARNKIYQIQHWKTKCFDELLWNYFIKNKNVNINILTIGDSWWDHSSIKQSLTYDIYGLQITHNQIKLYSQPDCRYLAVELSYISNLLDDKILFKFNTQTQHCQQQGLVLEFDGFEENDN